jgi:hypothetical protein
MFKTSKLLLIATIAASGIASPVLAQSRHNGRDAYAMVPTIVSHNATPWQATDPAYTGGGSNGYNENLLKDQW